MQKTAMKIFHAKVSVLLQKLFYFERYGKYEEALEELENIWEDTSDFPDVENLNAFEAAEMFLRCGSLIGFHGHTKQIQNSQEKSKNLLTEARSRFSDIENAEKIAECENYLALAYWRTGELVEAETWIETASVHHLSASNHTRIYTHLVKSLIYLSAGRNAEIVINLKKLETDFKNCNDAFLTGSFCTNLGLAFQELEKIPEALKYLELAEFYHQKSGHQIYLGTVENNLAQIYKKAGHFEKSHEAINRATKIFKNIKDQTREGFSLDTKAQIYFAQRKYVESLITSEVAISILEKGENCAYLVETYLTKTKALIYLNDISAATMCLFEAVQIAKSNISQSAADNLAKEFEKTIHEKNLFAHDDISPKTDADNDKLELILPPSIAHYQDIQGIWIKNTHLEKFGLRQGSLAVVVKEKIKRGDLVAIAELENKAVSCGFYDVDFGIVCLEGDNSEPQLFNESDIEILGKIIGVCDSEKNSDGKMPVKPLNAVY